MARSNFHQLWDAACVLHHLDVCVEQLNRQGIIDIKADGQRIPLEDNSADLTICFETLEHVCDPILFLAELSRITRQRLLLSVPWVPKTNIRPKWDGRAEPNGRPDSEFHVFEFEERDFRKILSYTDLKVNIYRKLANYKAKYDPLTNCCVKRHLYHSYFPALQAYVLERGK